MVRERFDASFEKLRDQSNLLAGVERTPENLDEIVNERAKLERTRKETRAERKGIVSRYEPPAPDVVEAPRGYQHTNRRGKVGAAITVGLLVACLFGFYAVITSLNPDYDVVIVNTTETLDDNCRWEWSATIRNDGPEAISVTGSNMVIERQQIRLTLEAPIDLDPGEVGTLTNSWRVGSNGPCPENVDDIGHGNLNLVLASGLEVGRGF